MNRTTTPGRKKITITFTRGVCDFSLYDGEGNFTTYGYPLQYRNNMDCAYRIKRVDESCQIQLTFHDFDVKSNDDDSCSNDFLIIAGERYCGSEWKGRTVSVNFSPELEELTLHFHTDSTGSGRGFWIEARKYPGICNSMSKEEETTCDTQYDEEEFTLTSPKYPKDYGNLEECRYLIKRRAEDVCGLEITFLHFDLEPSDGCIYDFLDVGGKKLCGTISPDAVRVFMFNVPEMVMRFITDDQTTRPGFNIRVRQVTDCSPATMIPAQVSCDVCTEQITDEIISYDYPKNYHNNLACTYSVDRHDDQYCRVELDFVDFFLDYSVDCVKDYLEINERRYCGSSLKGKKKFLAFDTNGSVVMNFKSDGTITRKGFRIKIRQIPCPRLLPTQPEKQSCDHMYAQETFYIQTPNYPADYSRDMNCRYIIRRLDNNVCQLNITFIAFDVEYSPNCERDYLEIENEKLCGVITPNSIRLFDLHDQEKILNFRSDFSRTRPGFFIRVTQKSCEPKSRAISHTSNICDRIFTSQEFEIKSLTYPKGDDRAMDCRYTIRRTSNRICQLQLNFLDFEVESGDDCRHAYFEVDGRRMCGKFSGGAIRSYQFHKPVKILRYRTDGSATQRGFHILARQMECLLAARGPRPCDRTFLGPQFVLTSENYPDNYDDDLDCRYTVRRYSDSVCRMELTITSFELQESEDCQNDYLEVEGEKICGNIPDSTVRTYDFREEEKTIAFHSDSSVTGKGFEILIKQKECEPLTTETTTLARVQCDEEFTEAEFDLNSPNYPEEYATNLNCLYTIKRSNTSICRLEMMILSFDVESSSGCEYDYLEIDGERLCGTLENVTRTYSFRDFQKTLRFKTDSATTRSGFKIRLKQIDCEAQASSSTPRQCDRVNTGLQFEIRSENYPQDYDHNLDCMYTVHRVSNEICQLELMFLKFDIESSDDCKTDYLEVDNQKLCGVLPENMRRVIEFTTDVKTFHFHSDSTTSRPGFDIRVTQVECPEVTSTTEVPASVCEHRFSDSSGTFESLGYPSDYLNNVRCTYTFLAQENNCRLELTFPQFRLEPSNTICEHDFLEMNGVRYCGRQLEGQTRTVSFHGNPPQVKIQFQSNDRVTELGFQANFQQLPCVQSQALKTTTPKPSKSPYPTINCDRLYASLDFEIRSPGYPNTYTNNLNCRYIVHRLSNRICELRLNFIMFDVESSTGCEYDYFEVEGEKLCGTMPGNSIREMEFRDYQIELKFHSDPANTRPGFLIQATQLDCMRESPFHPFDRKPHPQYPPPSFPSKHPPSSFHLPSKPYPDRMPPYLPKTHPRYPPMLPPKTHPRYPPMPPHPHHPPPPPGVPTNCDQIFTQNDFEFRSVNFPDFYPNGIHCRYTIRRTNDGICRLELKFVKFEVESSPNCLYDYLSIDGIRICGNIEDNDVATYKFNTPEKLIYFQSDSVSPSRGFLIKGHQKPCTGKSPHIPTVSPSATQCDATFNQESFTIKSPNYPDNYPTDISCKYTVKRFNDAVCALEVTFLGFDLEEEASCRYDYLDFDGKPICGHITSNTIRRYNFGLRSVDKEIIFRSDRAATRSGFHIQVRQQTDCAPKWKPVTPPPPLCDYCLKEERGHITSLNYPRDYADNLRCSYKIERVNRYCGLEMYFHEFEIESSVGCRKDYVLINGNRYCGSELKQQVKELSFPNKFPFEIKLTFNTDKSITRSGFHVEYRQIPCQQMPWLKPFESLTPRQGRMAFENRTIIKIEKQNEALMYFNSTIENSTTTISSITEHTENVNKQ
ncbi:LOW QUALITY PROTEIN: cubilin-like [Centruroides vittatus]|uniref:LOW QUALITY PROTEIN: cubilin-like n=1 Tax=Centruroides vittatus TaxID=120091 RepID=UPI00350F6549